MKPQLFTDQTECYTETSKFSDTVEFLGYKYCFRIVCGKYIYTCPWMFGSEEDIERDRDEHQRLFSGCEVEVVR